MVELLYTLFIRIGIPIPDRFHKVEECIGWFWYNGFMCFITGGIWIFWLLLKAWIHRRNSHSRMFMGKQKFKKMK